MKDELHFLVNLQDKLAYDCTKYKLFYKCFTKDFVQILSNIAFLFKIFKTQLHACRHFWNTFWIDSSNAFENDVLPKWLKRY